MPRIKIFREDTLFSWYIRERDKWTCQKCYTIFYPPTSGLHCSHFWGRGKWSTRYDEENCVALCYGCHEFFGAHPDMHKDFMLRRLGQQRYDLLMLRANTPTKVDKKLILIWLTSVLKEKGYKL